MPPLERDRELRLLEAAVAAAVDGRGGVAVLEGPAGIGKTALLDEARRRAAGSVTMLGARGGLLERDYGFGVVRQLLESATRGRELPEAARAVLADSFSEAGGLPMDGGFAALHGLFWVILDLAAERPLLLAVDDLQWADRPSLRLLAYLARRIEDEPVLVLATIRTGEADVDEDLLGAIREPPAQLVTPGPLSGEGVARLIADRLGEEPEPAFVDACVTATGGNPLLVRELASALEVDGVRPVAARAQVVRSIGPRAVSRTVGMRLARLPPDALAVARAVAVLGDGAPVADAARFAELDETRVAAASGPLARAEILRAEPPLAFVHPLVADAVLLALPPGERELQHARAARMLHAAGAPPEQVAGHLLRTPREAQPWVVEVLRAAARATLRRGAAESGVAFLRRALDEPPPADQRAALLLETGVAEVMGSGADAVEHLRGALATLVDPPLRALAAGALGRALLFTGDAAAGAAVADRVAAELPEELADLRDQLRAFALMTAWFDTRAPGAIAATAHLRDAVPGPEAGTGPRMLAAVASFAWSQLPGSAQDCAALARAALAGDHLMHADNGLLNIPPAILLVYAEDAEGFAHLHAGLAEAHRRGSLFAVGGLRLWLAGAQLWCGELQEAESTARQARDELTEWGFDEGPDYVSAFLAGTLVERGRLDEARAVIESSGVRDVPAEGARHWHQARLDLLVAERRDAEALEAVEILATRFAHARNPFTATWRTARAVVRHRAGDLDGAAADLEEHLALARTWGTPGPIGRTLRIRGELFGARDDLRDAVALLEGSTMRAEHARALAALGRSLRLDRRPADAREPLRDALAVAARCGADALAAEIRTELGAAGARPRTEALSGPDSLTPSERRVAALAAEGSTNRDIAQALFVTPKTVEVHLSAAYRKLGIASRRGLAQALTP